MPNHLDEFREGRYRPPFGGTFRSPVQDGRVRLSDDFWLLLRTALRARMQIVAAKVSPSSIRVALTGDGVLHRILPEPAHPVTLDGQHLVLAPALADVLGDAPEATVVGHQAYFQISRCASVLVFPPCSHSTAAWYDENGSIQFIGIAGGGERVSLWARWMLAHRSDPSCRGVAMTAATMADRRAWVAAHSDPRETRLFESHEAWIKMPHAARLTDCSKYR